MLVGTVLIPAALEEFLHWPHAPKYEYGSTHGFWDALIATPFLCVVFGTLIAIFSKPGDSADPDRASAANETIAGVVATHHAVHSGDHD